MSEQFFVGSAVKSTVTFTSSGAYVDPTTVYFQVRDPDANVAEYQYGVDAEISKTSTGVYVFESIDVDDEGTWHVRWRGEGSYQCAVELRFVAMKTPFV